MKKFKIKTNPTGLGFLTRRVNKTRICLWAILLLAFFLRFYKLNRFPAGLNADEAAIGYNVYSLIQTGRDEHGDSWPIHFKSFGDYKPGLYFYLVLPFVKILGLNIWAVRLPSAILGMLSVWVMYLLVKELFSASLGLVAAILLAISPWHIHFSRGGWEANVATFFILAGIYMFLKALKSPRLFTFSLPPEASLAFSGLFFTLSLYTYHSARMVAPLLGLGLVLLYRKELLKRLFSKQGKLIVVSVIVASVLLIPLVRDFLGPAGVSRFSGVGILADQGPYWRVNEQRGEHQNWNSPLAKILHNRPIYYGLSFLENWADHFHGEFLFLSGDVIERNRVPETGQMYLFDIPFVILGFYFFLKNRPKNWQIVFLWLAVAPAAAAMTFQTPHALRAHNMVIPLVIITAYGLYYFMVWLEEVLASKLPGKPKNLKLIFTYSLLVVVYGWNFARYLHQYYIHYPQTYPEAWEYGFEQLVDYVKEVEGQYNKIYVTDKYDQPYILFLFYLNYPPEKFQKEVILTPRDKFGFSTMRSFDKFHFEEINWEKVKNYPDSLIIGTAEEIPDSAEIIKIINFPNGKSAFKIAKT